MIKIWWVTGRDMYREKCPKSIIQNGGPLKIGCTLASKLPLSWTPESKDLVVTGALSTLILLRPNVPLDRSNLLYWFTSNKSPFPLWQISMCFYSSYFRKRPRSWKHLAQTSGTGNRLPLKSQKTKFWNWYWKHWNRNNVFFSVHYRLRVFVI